MEDKELFNSIMKKMGLTEDEMLKEDLANIDDDCLDQLIDEVCQEYNYEGVNDAIQNFIYPNMSIKDALIAGKKEQDQIKDSFHITFDAYNCTNRLRIYSIQKLRLTKLKIQLLGLYSLIINNGSQNTLYNIEQRINLAINDMKYQKHDFKEIKKGLKRLKKQNNDICNLDICKLIALLFKRNDLIIKDLNDFIYECNCNLRGYGFSSSNNYEEEIKELTDAIKGIKLTLGINNKKMED